MRSISVALGLLCVALATPAAGAAAPGGDAAPGERAAGTSTAAGARASAKPSRAERRRAQRARRAKARRERVRRARRARTERRQAARERRQAARERRQAARAADRERRQAARAADRERRQAERELLRAERERARAERERLRQERRQANAPHGWVWPPSPEMRAQGKACKARLADRGVAFRPAEPVPRVVTPIVLDDLRVGDLRLVSLHREPPFVMDCHLADALAHVAPRLRALGVIELRFTTIHDFRKVKVNGKRGNTLSRHSYGLAIDVFELVTESGTVWDIEADYADGGGILHAVEFVLNADGGFRTVISPALDPISHDDHFHLEAAVERLSLAHGERIEPVRRSRVSRARARAKRARARRAQARRAEAKRAKAKRAKAKRAKAKRAKAKRAKAERAGAKRAGAHPARARRAPRRAGTGDTRPRRGIGKRGTGAEATPRDGP